MASPPTLTTCPPWIADVPSELADAFIKALTSVYQAALANVHKALPDETEIKHWHGQLFKDVVPIDYYAGNFRCDDPQDRPCLGTDVCVDGVRGVSFSVVPLSMRRLLGELEKTFKTLELTWGAMPPRDRALRVVATIAFGVGELIRIHPFVNGNGRVSRILWAAFLHRFGAPPQARVVPRPPHPYGEVMKASMKGDHTPLMHLILQGLASAPQLTRPLS